MGARKRGAVQQIAEKEAQIRELTNHRRPCAVWIKVGKIGRNVVREEQERRPLVLIQTPYRGGGFQEL